eukprot:SM000076S21824  [mRNA]  locus=s76:399489:401373:+ [translate_table: standard]
MGVPWPRSPLALSALLLQSLLFLVAATSAVAQIPKPVLTARLSGQNDNGPADAVGSSRFDLTYHANGKTTMGFAITGVSGLPAGDKLILAHIHVGTVDVHDGKVVVNLVPYINFTDFTLTGAAAGRLAIDTALADAIYSNPDGYYVNVHSNVYPAGLIRGQLADPYSANQQPAANSLRFSSALLGSNEPNSTSNGSGSAKFAFSSINSTTELVEFLLNVTGLDFIFLAHIHAGAASVSGPVVIDFVPAIRFGSFNTNHYYRGYVTTNKTLVDNITAPPDNYYTNIHTNKYPAGAVRGQLAANTTSGSNPAPPPPVNMTGGGYSRSLPSWLAYGFSFLGVAATGALL